jgi:uncharacterized membrane protein
MTETHWRTIVKSISWRIVATGVTAYFTGLTGAIIINIWMTVAYYIHERMWTRVKWGFKPFFNGRKI